jgi:hypothetical protein
MGAVLAMKIAILMLALLAACAQKPAPDLRGLLSRAAIDRSPQPLILAELPSQNVVATLIPRDTLDGVVTWRTGRGQTLSFRDGVLVATRSLGNDLMSADVAGTQAALRGGPDDLSGRSGSDLIPRHAMQHGYRPARHREQFRRRISYHSAGRDMLHD